MRPTLLRLLSVVAALAFSAFTVAGLTGCGAGPGTASPASGAGSVAAGGGLVPAPRNVVGDVELNGPVNNATVRIVLSDGRLWGQAATTSSAGDFDVLEGSLVGGAVASLATGLDADEMRVLVSTTDGTLLMADVPVETDTFARVNLLSTGISMLRQRVPGLTEEEAEAELHSFFEIPDGVSLSQVGDPASPFCLHHFLLEAARNGGLRSYLATLVDEMVVDLRGHGTRGARSRPPRHHVTHSYLHTDALLLGVDRYNREIEGTADPGIEEIIQALQSDATVETQPIPVGTPAPDGEETALRSAPRQEEEEKEPPSSGPRAVDIWSTAAMAVMGIGMPIAEISQLYLARLGQLNDTINAYNTFSINRDPAVAADEWKKQGRRVPTKGDSNAIKRTGWVTTVGYAAAGLGAVGSVVAVFASILDLAGGGSSGPFEALFTRLDDIDNRMDEIEKAIMDATVAAGLNERRAEIARDALNVNAKRDEVDYLNGGLKAITGGHRTTGGFQLWRAADEESLKAYAQFGRSSGEPAVGEGTLARLLMQMTGVGHTPSNIVQDYFRVTMSELGVDDQRSLMRYGFRTNRITRYLHGFVATCMKIVDCAITVCVNQAQAHYGLRTSPAGEVQAAIEFLEEKSLKLEGWSVSALRRLALQQVPPLLPSDKVCVDGRNRLVWSTEFITRRADQVGRWIPGGRVVGSAPFFIYGATYSVDGFPYAWQLATRDHLATLPKNKTLARYGFKTVDGGGLPRSQDYDGNSRVHVVAADYSLALPHREDLVAEFKGERFYFNGAARVYGQIAFIDFESESRGLLSPSRFADGTVLVGLPVLDLNQYTSREGFAWPDREEPPPKWWPKWYASRSSVMLAAGIQPDHIVVLRHEIDNPHFLRDRQFLAKKIVVLSALAFWVQQRAADGTVLRGVVEDVSGRVVWRSSDTSVAKVYNMLTYDPDSSEKYAKQGLFVSPFYAPVIVRKFGKDVKVELSAHWIQGTSDNETPSITLNIPEPNPDFGVPIRIGRINVSPGNYAFSHFDEVKQFDFFATAYLTDRSVVDVTQAVTWSVQVLEPRSGGGFNRTPLDPTYGQIVNAGAARGQLQLKPAAATLPVTQLRIRATYARSDGSKVEGYNDIRLEFPQP